MILGALTCEELSIQHTCLYLTSSGGRHEAFGLLLDIDDRLIDTRIAFTNISFSFFSYSKKKKLFAKLEAFRKGLIAIFGQGNVVLKFTS